MTNIHKEKYFEAELVEHLAAHGWLEGKNEGYDRKLALYPEDAVWWAKIAYPEAWARLEAQNGAKTEALFLDRLTAELEQGGTLGVLRHGFKIAGAGSTRFAMAQFKPSSGLNPQTLALYDAVRCRVVRQVFYSEDNRNSIDLVLFVNGLPTATLELKTESTQSVYQAMLQYRKDRLPKNPVTHASEPLLQFKSRCLVHFAVSTEEAYMTTRLAGESTYFLPFNRGDNGDKGNPVNPDGARTAFLWERVIERNAWLDILGRFVHLERSIGKDGMPKESLIFPRFHQWDCVTGLAAKALEDGPGHRYLIQHSAGSGKSNSIAWLAHRLSSLHDDGDRKVFDAVIVITDRKVLDRQLRDTVYQFEHKQGVVEAVTHEAGVKSDQLRDALLNGKQIVIVTIQTFQPLLDKIEKETSLKNRRFAVIADEAHSSQTGTASASLKKVLAQEGIDPEDVTAEDLIVSDLASRSRTENISFFAFTATPKTKTMELFGSPDGNGGKRPFHTYSMRQAIEERFILDVLRNFISYKIAYRLANDGKEFTDDMVDKNKGMSALTRWVRLHPYNIAQKVKIIVEHYRENVMWRLDGTAKAMVVTSSREEVIRYKLEIDRYIKANKYGIGTLVAFSGDIDVKELDTLPFNERNMNPEIGRTDIREAFDGPGYHILLVANKYQTGFDQPKLTAMYVDKKLSGVATVQTMSRLNRTYPGKDFTVVVDFTNDPDLILADFKLYYAEAALPECTDPHLLYKIQEKLDSSGIYLESEVEAFASFYWDPRRKPTHMGLQRHLQPPAERFADRYRTALGSNDTQETEALRIFLKDLGTFCRMYEFLSQIVDYNDEELEKRYAYFRELSPILQAIFREARQDDATIDLSGVRLSHYALRKRGEPELALETDPDLHLLPLDDPGTGKAREQETVKLLELIEQLNGLFEGELSDSDLVQYAYTVRSKLLENVRLRDQAVNNSRTRFHESDDLTEAVLQAVEEHHLVDASLTKQIMANERTRKGFIKLMADMVFEAFNAKAG